jgi:hypothetical protein
MNEDEDLFAQGPECDFCKIPVEPDESLTPIYVGELPQPKPHYLSQTAQRGGMRGNRYKGKYDALRKALYDCPDVTLNESNVVHEVEAVGGASHFMTEDELTSHDAPTDFTTTRTEKVGVELKIRPKDVTYEPDAEVCDVCAEMFKNL